MWWRIRPELVCLEKVPRFEPLLLAGVPREPWRAMPGFRHRMRPGMI